MDADEPDNLVSLADVAKLAGVTRPAASNWRRRHEDFPAPVRETGAAALFDRAAITAWLTAHGKPLARPSLRDEVAAALNTVRAGTTTDAVARTYLTALADGAGPTKLSRLVDEHGAPAVVEALIAEVVARERRDPWLDVPAEFVDLVVALAEPHLTGTVYDPNSGLGTFLLAAHRAGRDRPLRLVGHTPSVEAHAIATTRMLAHGVTAELRVSTRSDAPPADVVLTAHLGGHYLAMAGGLDFSARSLRQGGHGFCLSSHAMLRGKPQLLRKELVRRGAVRAVVELPATPITGRVQRAALWILGAESDDVEEVLLIDAGGTALDELDFRRVVTTYRGWQATGKLPPDGLPAVAVARERLLVGDCRLTVASWLDSDIAGALHRLEKAKARMAVATKVAAEPVLPPELAGEHEDMRSIQDLIESGDAEFVRGPVRPAPDELASETAKYISTSYRDDWIAEPIPAILEHVADQAKAEVQRGDVLISNFGHLVCAAVVPEDGGVVVGREVHCLRLHRPSMARSRTIAALLSASGQNASYGETRDFLVRWPSDEECERIARVLDVIVKLRRDAAETLAAAEAINESALAALLAGAVPVEAAREAP